MSRRARDWFWRCRGLTPALRCILSSLAEHADDEGRCWPSLSRLAALNELDRRTVTRGLAALEARGLLRRERSHGRSTTYRLALEEAGQGGAGGVPASTRGVTPPQQGPDAPRGVTPRGARDPLPRGVPPPGRGRIPPDAGASDPPNLHKNRHITGNEPSVCRDVDHATDPHPQPEKNERRPKATLIPPDWRPSERVFAWAAKQGMSRTWVEAQLDEFLVYWGDAGERRKSWDATFINRLQALQANQPLGRDHEPEPRLADKDYTVGATPIDQIPWLKHLPEP